MRQSRDVTVARGSGMTWQWRDVTWRWRDVTDLHPAGGHGGREHQLRLVAGRAGAVDGGDERAPRRRPLEPVRREDHRLDQ